MNGRILDKYTGRSIADGDSAVVQDENGIDNFGCFGWLRGIRDRALSVELRQANGNIVAIPYHGIERFEFDPSEGIALAVAGKKIRVKGRNLNAEVRPSIRLFEGLTRHRISWIREASDGESESVAESDTIVDLIQW